MRRKTLFPLLTLLWVFGAVPPSQAQGALPYVTRATLYISVDDWADIWLNGRQIVDSQPYTGVEKGYQVRKCLPEHLCYFEKENVLAIEVSDRTNPPDPQTDTCGIAYCLELQFSDGSTQLLSSNETLQHRAYYLGDWRLSVPRGWQGRDYDDRGWAPAKGTGISIPHLAQLAGPEFGGAVGFLSSNSFSSKVQNVGERHFFRREFHLDISPNPLCAGRAAVLVPTPVRRVLFLPRPSARPTPPPTGTPTPVFRSSPSPAAMDFVPTVFSEGRKAFLVPTTFLPFTPTPTLGPVVPVRLEPLGPETTPPSRSQVVLPRLSPAPTITPPEGKGPGQTVVFRDGTANIYLRFADGPGTYRLEVLDGRGRHLRHLFEMNVVTPAETWVDWDGKDDQGRDVSVQKAVIVLSRNDQELRRITVIRGRDGE